MGSSESKVAANVSTPKADPTMRLKNQRVAQLADPRSPTSGIDRTPIQMASAVSKSHVEEATGSSVMNDPRSPTQSICRTPLKDSMRVTVSSFARRMGMLLLNESSVVEAAPLPHVTFSKYSDLRVEELGSTEPLLTHCTAQDSEVFAPSQGYGALVSNPSVLISEVEVQADLLAEDALLANASPLLKRELSLSLLTCHDGVHPSQIEEEEAAAPIATPSTEVVPCEQEQEGSEDHTYALPVVSAEPEPEPPVSPPPVAEPAPEPALCDAPVASLMVVEVTAEPESSPQLPTAPPASVAPPPPASVAPPPPASVAPPSPASVAPPSPASIAPPPPALLQPQAPTAPANAGIRCPTFDTKSPSQVVFKPQWLGVGFGATGIKPRSLQGRTKGTSSPLASRKPTDSENQGLSVKSKQRGKVLASEGRSPLQILRETNSPREKSQMKLKISTPDRQRLGQLDRRTLIQSLNKENQR